MPDHVDEWILIGLNEVTTQERIRLGPRAQWESSNQKKKENVQVQMCVESSSFFFVSPNDLFHKAHNHRPDP